MITTKLMKFFPLFILLALLWSSCKSPSASEVQMPPNPPHDKIQSAIFPETTPREPVVETQTLPQGVSLQFKGKEVSLEELANLSEASLQHKVTVLAHPSTRYGEVAKVMDQLHEMGFMITFQATE